MLGLDGCEAVDDVDNGLFAVAHESILEERMCLCDLENRFDFHGDLERKRGSGHGGAGMPSGLAKHFHQ